MGRVGGSRGTVWPTGVRGAPCTQQHDRGCVATITATPLAADTVPQTAVTRVPPSLPLWTRGQGRDPLKQATRQGPRREDRYRCARGRVASGMVAPRQPSQRQ